MSTATIDAPAVSDAPESAADQSASQAPRIRVRIEDRDMQTRYTNAFRSNAATDELMLDFGINSVAAGQPGGMSEVRFNVSDRLIMNWPTAKRLAMLLGNLVREHEQQHGEVKIGRTERTRA